MFQLKYCPLLLILFSVPSFAERVHVAVASNFTGAMQAIVAAFEKDTGHRIELSFGSSGKFYAQIKNGAPFQAFFSADQVKPKALVEEGFAVASSQFTYAVGALALWSADSSLLDAQGLVLQGKFNKLALANPRLAPYGAAAIEILDNLGLVESTRARWVQGENISQTYQFVATGNADIGFVALSQVTVEGKLMNGSAWIVPKKLYNPIRQDAVILKTGANNSVVNAFMAFVQSKTAEKIIQTYGYDIENSLKPE